MIVAPEEEQEENNKYIFFSLCKGKFQINFYNTTQIFHFQQPLSVYNYIKKGYTLLNKDM